MRSSTIPVALWVFLFSVVTLAQRSGTDRGTVFFGCYDSYPTGATAFGTSTSTEACAASCAGTSNPLFAFYSTTTKDCRCGNQYNQPNVLRTGNLNACTNTSNYQYIRTSTTFTTYGAACRTNAQLGNPTYAAAAGPRSCHVKCASNVYAFYYADSSSGTWQCACSNTIATTASTSATCGPGNTFVWIHSTQAQASQLDRRRKVDMAQKREADRIKYRYCPPGFTACHVPETEGGYECVDTQSDIDSCGGCINGYYGSGTANATELPTGRDCGTLGAAMGGYTCEKGRCRIHACGRGRMLVHGACVRSRLA